MRIYYACKTSLTFTAAYQPEYQLQETVLNPRALKVQIHRLLGFERFLTPFPLFAIGFCQTCPGNIWPGYAPSTRGDHYINIEVFVAW